jgi:predicted nucleotidyltransferase
MNARASVTFEDVGSILSAHKEELLKVFGVSEIGVFGSVASGTAKEGSDVDVLVSFSRPIGFIAFMRLERRLQELLGRKVDLVTRKALRPFIGKRILSEVRFV